MRCPATPPKNVPMNTHTQLRPVPVDGETANSMLYLGLYWEEAKLNNVLIKSRAKW